MSDTDKLRCVERELAFRRLVYPPSVKAGKMSQREADYEIRMMESIANDYREKIAPFTETGNLFDQTRTAAGAVLKDRGRGQPGSGGGHD